MTWVDRDGIAWLVTFSTSGDLGLNTRVTMETDVMRYSGCIPRAMHEPNPPTATDLQKVLDLGRASMQARARSERQRQLGD